MIKELFLNPIKADLQKVDETILLWLGKEDSPAIQDISDHIMLSAGKRLRPAITLLTFKALAEKSTSEINSENCIKIASAIELIHMASLVHDDAIDHSDSRRGNPSVFKKWGTDVAISMGVYLYSIALNLIAEVGNRAILTNISQSVTHLCQGELNQVLERNNPFTTHEEYIDILRKKTAALFRASCTSGAILAGAPYSTQENLSCFGEDIGIVFQLIDDILDVSGASDVLEKESGKDFEMGEMTLPLLLLLEKSSGENKKKLLSFISGKSESSLDVLREEMKQHNSKNKSMW